MACHRRIEGRLEILERAVAHWEDRPTEAREAVRNVFRFLDSSAVQHTADEEESIFPRLMPQLERGERAYLAGLEHQHSEAHRIYAELKALVESGGAAQDLSALVDRFATHYRQHIASEDDVLQSYAREHLTAQQLDDIAAEMKRRRGL